MVPSDTEVELAEYGQLVEIYVEAEVDYGYIYPFEGGPTITLRESMTTFVDTSPEFYEMNALTPFPRDPGAR